MIYTLIIVLLIVGVLLAIKLTNRKTPYNHDTYSDVLEYGGNYNFKLGVFYLESYLSSRETLYLLNSIENLSFSFLQFYREENSSFLDKNSEKIEEVFTLAFKESEEFHEEVESKWVKYLKQNNAEFLVTQFYDNWNEKSKIQERDEFIKNASEFVANSKFLKN
jgi:HD-GYP domain-containing protein (c-di-GMP phosphodiesterase class II)